MKGLAKGHMDITHRHRQLCGDRQRDRSWGISGGGQREENGHICNSVNDFKKIERKTGITEHGNTLDVQGGILHLQII